MAGGGNTVGPWQFATYSWPLPQGQPVCHSALGSDPQSLPGEAVQGGGRPGAPAVCTPQSRAVRARFHCEASTNWRGLSIKESFLNIQFCSNYSLPSFCLDLTKPSFSVLTKKKCLGQAWYIKTWHRISLKPQELCSNCHLVSINSHETL